MDTEIKKCVFVGLPESGKSTFIAALWHVTESGEVENSIKIQTLPENREYLNTLRSAWQSCKHVERNKGEFINPILLNAYDPVTKTTGEFAVPDIAGEMYDSQFESRKLTKDFIQLVETADGLILFVDPETLRQPKQVTEAQILTAVLTEGSETNEPATSPAVASSLAAVTEPSKSEENISPWKHKDVPTQVVLVDLLQIISGFIKKRVKLAVVVSAWDLITNSTDEVYKNLKPEEWIKSQLPLLHQYLKTNTAIFEYITYGISAQGGKYKIDKEKLQNFAKASDRIKVQIESTVSNDITKPLKWLIHGEN